MSGRVGLQSTGMQTTLSLIHESARAPVFPEVTTEPCSPRLQPNMGDGYSLERMAMRCESRESVTSVTSTSTVFENDPPEEVKEEENKTQGNEAPNSFMRGIMDAIIEVIQSDYERLDDNSFTSRMYFFLSWLKKVCLCGLILVLFLWISCIHDFEFIDTKLCLLMLILVQIQECKCVSQDVVNLRMKYVNHMKSSDEVSSSIGSLNQISLHDVDDDGTVIKLQTLVRRKLLGYIILETFLVICFVRSCFSMHSLHTCFTEDVLVTLISILVCLGDYFFNVIVFFWYYRSVRPSLLQTRFSRTRTESTSVVLGERMRDESSMRQRVI